MQTKLCKWLDCSNEALPNNPLCEQHLARVLGNAGGFRISIKEIGVGLGIGVVGNALYQVILSALSAGSGLLNFMTVQMMNRQFRMRAAAKILGDGIDDEALEAAAIQIESLPRQISKWS